MTDLLSQAQATVARLLTFASPEWPVDLAAFAANPEGDGHQLQAFRDSTVDPADEAQVQRFCERVAERTGGEFVLVAPGLKPVEHIVLVHYSGGPGVGRAIEAVGGAMALVNRQPGRAPTLSEWVEQPSAPGAGDDT